MFIIISYNISTQIVFQTLECDQILNRNVSKKKWHNVFVKRKEPKLRIYQF
jgi:hypothetical protein